MMANPTPGSPQLLSVDRMPPSHPSTIFEETNSENQAIDNGNGKENGIKREVSIDETRNGGDDLSKPRRKPTNEDQKAIDKYYDNNHYTISGRYAKNEDTLNHIPKNFQRIVDGHRLRRAASMAEKSTVSRRSTKSTLPIPGANENRFLDSVYWLVHSHSLFGFRHLMMILALALLTMAGGAMFYTIEKDAEKLDLDTKLAVMRGKLETISAEMMAQRNSENNTLIDEELVRGYLRRAYKELLVGENRYTLSAYHKKDDFAKNRWWSWWCGVFATTDIFMTVSYGVVPFYSNLGRGVLMVYGLIAIPLAVVVMRDLGQWQLTICTKIYAFLLIRWRKAKGVETPEDEEIEFPVSLSFIHMMCTWCLGAAFIYFYDGLWGPDGISFWGSFYLSYLTATTIGMGDMVPTYATRDPTWKFVHFFFLMPSRVLNRCTYVAIEGSIFSFATRCEEWLTGVYQTKKIAPISKRSRTRSRGTGETGEPQSEEAKTFSHLIAERQDVYRGDFGRVKVNKSHLE
ncbi:unnamed protein product, partial [Mesorhabditis belari]|uniref:Potassium channel domain-containing protein n=1 Tax=Mesorhabditis belari TaxID=2138241 RepID=A0AAF3FLR2_9BILA